MRRLSHRLPLVSRLSPALDRSFLGSDAHVVRIVEHRGSSDVSMSAPSFGICSRRVAVHTPVAGRVWLGGERPRIGSLSASGLPVSRGRLVGPAGGLGSLSRGLALGRRMALRCGSTAGSAPDGLDGLPWAIQSVQTL